MESKIASAEEKKRGHTFELSNLFFPFGEGIDGVIIMPIRILTLGSNCVARQVNDQEIFFRN
jgi:hypothetical protein